MKHLLTTPVLVATLSISSLVCASEINMRPGKWEITGKTEMTGMPMQMQIPETTFSSCIKEEDLDQPFFGEKEQNCKFSETGKSGNSRAWRLECIEDGGKMTGTGEFTFNKDTYSGVMKMNMQRDGQSMNMTVRYTGKRIGDC